LGGERSISALKVLHVVPSLGLRHGGVSVSIRELCYGLARLGVGVQVWTTSRAYDPPIDGPTDDRLRSAGVGVRYFPVHPWGWLGQRYAYSPALSAALREGVWEADLVHIHALWLHPTRAAAQTCQQVGRPYIVSPCGALDPYSLRIHWPLKRAYGLWIERRTLAGAAAVHFTSSQEQNQSDMLGTSPATFVVPRCLETDSIPATLPRSFRQQHPSIGESKILLFLGRLHPKKRLDIVARAFILAARRRGDLHLVISGPEDGSGPPVRKLLQEAGMLDRTTFTGLLAGKEKWAAFRESSLFLLPSEDENFGMGALEAMSCGIPVLLSRQVGISAAAEHAGAGIVLEQNPSSWAEAIDQLLKNPQRMQDLGEAGRRLAEGEFSCRQVASAMRQAYLDVLKRSQPVRP